MELGPNCGKIRPAGQNPQKKTRVVELGPNCGYEEVGWREEAAKSGTHSTIRWRHTMTQQCNNDTLERTTKMGSPTVTLQHTSGGRTEWA